MEDRKLVREAILAREQSYAPYSGFMVGAALLGESGTVYRGCNIESASYSPTNCAERTAFFKAISEGERRFLAIAIVGAFRDTPKENWDFCYPCGVCRQVMAEFCSSDTFRILTARSEDEWKSCTLGELLPHGFGPADLERK